MLWVEVFSARPFLELFHYYHHTFHCNSSFLRNTCPRMWLIIAHLLTLELLPGLFGFGSVGGRG